MSEVCNKQKEHKKVNLTAYAFEFSAVKQQIVVSRGHTAAAQHAETLWGGV